MTPNLRTCASLLVSGAEMEEIDRRAQSEYSIPALVLMESAALGGWQALREERSVRIDRSSVVVVAGKGNNGGDALAMARYFALYDACRPVVVLGAAPDELSPACRTHRDILERIGVEIVPWDGAAGRAAGLLMSATLIIDGIAGTGVRGALRSPLDTIAQAVNGARAAGAVVVAVDTPSGLGDAWRPGMPSVSADLTLAMGAAKRFFYQPAARSRCGTVRVVPVSFPARLLDPADHQGVLVDHRAYALPPLPMEGYKHSRGVVAVFAGCVGTTGAAILAATGAARCRAGLVTLFCDREVYEPLSAALVGVMVRPVEPETRIDLSRFDSVVVGPGWGMSSDRRPRLHALLTEASSGVIDADALTLLSQADDLGALGERWVLTPHPGELGRLLGVSRDDVTADLIGAALQAAGRYGSVVVAKSHTTVVAAPDGRYAVVDGQNPALGTGGSGDVLAGAVGGLLAAGLSGWDAAVGAVALHQRAGLELRRTRGLFLAEELPAEIGRLADCGSDGVSYAG